MIDGRRRFHTKALGSVLVCYLDLHSSGGRVEAGPSKRTEGRNPARRPPVFGLGLLKDHWTYGSTMKWVCHSGLQL